jgi:hypothetical protein
VNEEQEIEARLDALLKAVRAQTKGRLTALKIGTTGRRLAGQPITDRTPGTGKPEFVLGATLPGPVPDLQHVYRVSTEILPNDYETCVQDSKTQDHRIVVRLDAFEGSADETRDTPKASRSVEVPWEAGDTECAASVRVTDVIEAPAKSGDTERTIVVVMLAISWSGHAETSRYLAAFVPLPKS